MSKSIVGYSGNMIEYEDENGSRHELKKSDMSPEQQKLFDEFLASSIFYKQNHHLFKNENDNVHHIFHPFIEKVKEWKETISGSNSELQDFMLELVDSDPLFKDSIQVCRVDDHWFMSSFVFIIPHATNYEYMGMSVWFVPQNQEQTDCQFFMYPGHSESVLSGINAVLNKFNPNNSRLKYYIDDNGFRYNPNKSALNKHHDDCAKKLLEMIQ